MTPIHIEKHSYRPHEAAGQILKAMRAQARVDVSENDAVAWTGLSLNDARAGLLFLAAGAGGRLFSAQGRVMVAFDRLPAWSWYGVPAGWARTVAQLRGVLHMGWPLLALAMAATAVSGTVALYLGVALWVFPGMDGPAVWVISAFLLAMMVFVLPAMVLLLAVALPVLAVGALVSGEVVASLAMLPAALVMWVALPTLWQLGRGVSERVWELVRQVYNFGRVTGDAFEDERLFVQLARARRGRLVVADLCVLYGWTPARAMAETSRLLVDFGGTATVDGDGRLWLEFSDLSDGVPLAPSPIWVREREPQLVFDQRSRRLDAVMLVVMVFGVGAYFYLVLQRYEPTRLAAEYVWRHWSLDARAGAVLAAFAVIFVPGLVLVRRAVVQMRQAAWGRRRAWFDLLRLASVGRGTIRQGEFDGRAIAELGGREVEKQGLHQVLEFPEFQQMEFSHDAWEQPHRR